MSKQSKFKANDQVRLKCGNNEAYTVKSMMLWGSNDVIYELHRNVPIPNTSNRMFVLESDIEPLISDAMLEKVESAIDSALRVMFVTESYDERTGEATVRPLQKAPLDTIIERVCRLVTNYISQ